MIIEKLNGDPLDSEYDELDALPSDVLSPTTFIGKSKEIDNGEMVNRGTVTGTLSFGNSFTIQQGYHTGLGNITAMDLKDVTIGSITPNKMANGKTAWVNGQLVTGVLQEAIPATQNIIYAAPSFFVQIPEGIYKNFINTCDLTGEQIRSAANIDLNFITNDQYIFDTIKGNYTSDATVTLSTLRAGKTVYSKGQKLTGTMNVPSLY